MYQTNSNKMAGLRNDLLLTAYGQPEITSPNTSGPKAHKVSLDSTGEEVYYLPNTPPDSPVFAELTTAGQDIKPDITKLNKAIQFHEGPQAVPNLEMNPSLVDSVYSNTVYSPYQTTLSFSEGPYCDDPLGTSNTVLVKQEPDSVFPDVLACSSSSLDSMCAVDQSNHFHYMHGWESQTMSTSVFEAAPIIKDEYSSIPSPTRSSPFDSMNGFHQGDPPLPNFTSFTGPVGSRDHLNSGGEEFDSGSEASFSLTTGDSEDSLDDISPFDPNNTLSNTSMRPRTHHYKRNTVDVTMMKGGIPKVTIANKKRGRPRKIHSFPGVDGNGLFHNSGTRGRGRREAMKGNHLWEFIRDLLKDPTYSPKFIRWEEKEDGVFRFVNSEAVATMWGRKKNNPGMTYEKLSRAMRYYYKRDILERVDGRRLVYKFGKNATGWREAAGISNNDSVEK